MKKVLRNLWSGWKSFAHVVGRTHTRVLLTLLYFLLLTPLGSIMRLCGWDPLESSPHHADRFSNWKPSAQPEPDLDSLRRQS